MADQIPTELAESLTKLADAVNGTTKQMNPLIVAEKDLVKEIIQRMADEFEMNKRLSRKLAKVYHKRNIEEEIAASEELSETYDMIVSKDSNTTK